jgi:hypothetical protein
MTGIGMTQALDPQAVGELSPLALNHLLPERPALIGEFSPAYEAFREATVADLAPTTNYEYIQALQLVDLNWAILQAKASADVELSTGTETTVKSMLGKALEREGEREYERGLRVFVEGGGDEDDSRTPLTGTQLSSEWRGLRRGSSPVIMLSARSAPLRQSRLALTPGSS